MPTEPSGQWNVMPAGSPVPGPTLSASTALPIANAPAWPVIASAPQPKTSPGPSDVAASCAMHVAGVVVAATPCSGNATVAPSATESVYGLVAVSVAIASGAQMPPARDGAPPVSVAKARPTSTSPDGQVSSKK